MAATKAQIMARSLAETLRTVKSADELTEMANSYDRDAEKFAAMDNDLSEWAPLYHEHADNLRMARSQHQTWACCTSIIGPVCQHLNPVRVH